MGENRDKEEPGRGKVGWVVGGLKGSVLSAKFRLCKVQHE